MLLVVVRFTTWAGDRIFISIRSIVKVHPHNTRTAEALSVLSRNRPSNFVVEGKYRKIKNEDDTKLMLKLWSLL